MRKKIDWIKFSEKRKANLLKILSSDLNLGQKQTFDVHFVNRPQMIKINAQYRGKKKETDVLSFEAPDEIKEMGYLGEIVVCIPVLREQAKDRKLSAEMEFDILMVHGVLHLLGYDHERGHSFAKKMANLETQILKKLASKASITQSNGKCLMGLIERVG